MRLQYNPDTCRFCGVVLVVNSDEMTRRVSEFIADGANPEDALSDARICDGCLDTAIEETLNGLADIFKDGGLEQAFQEYEKEFPLCSLGQDVRNDIREHTEDHVRRRALQIFSDAFPYLPQDVEEIIAFVERQEYLDSVGKQGMYDAIREL